MRENSVKSVLLVDDDTSARDLLSRQLEAAGFEARQAEDGIDGLVKLRDEIPKVIISDIQMPRMSGIEFVSVVRLRFPSIPVIVLSGSSPVELPAETEPDAWFEKGSLQIRELLRVLQDLAGKTSDRTNVPLVVSTPVRTLPCGDGEFVITCPDCLRRFQVMSSSDDKTVERVAVCTHCEARVPFLVENSEPA